MACIKFQDGADPINVLQPREEVEHLFLISHDGVDDALPIATDACGVIFGLRTPHTDL